MADGPHEAHALAAALGDVLVLELLRPREAEALEEVAAALDDMRHVIRRQYHAQAAAGDVGEADMVALEVPASDMEDAVRHIAQLCAVSVHCK